jgi:D-alanine transaminase
LNGKYLARSAATISVEDRGFVFGDGVYEVWRAVNGRLFEIDRHLDRLAFGLRELRISLPEPPSHDSTEQIADRLLRESGLTDGEATFYMEVTRGAAPRAHQFPPSDTPPTVYATVNRLTPPEALRARGASAITLPDIRWLRCDIKTIQLLPNVWAKQAAVERGAVDALMIRDGVVTEGSHANIIGVPRRDDSHASHKSPHSSRHHPLDRARHGPRLWHSCQRRTNRGARHSTTRRALPRGTTTDVMPIVRVNDNPVGNGAPGPITVRLLKEFRAFLDASCAAAHASP